MILTPKPLTNLIFLQIKTSNIVSTYLTIICCLAKIPPTAIIRQSTENMNNVKSGKYDMSPNDIEKKSLSSERFKTLFNLIRIERSKKKSLMDLIDMIKKNMPPRKENCVKI